MENCANYFCFLVSLGNSWELRPVWALEISGGPESTRPTVPRIRYVAGVHGNAAAGPELLLEFASVLCINYGGNPVITKVHVTHQQHFFCHNVYPGMRSQIRVLTMTLRWICKRESRMCGICQGGTYSLSCSSL